MSFALDCLQLHNCIVKAQNSPFLMKYDYNFEKINCNSILLF